MSRLLLLLLLLLYTTICIHGYYYGRYQPTRVLCETCETRPRAHTIITDRQRRKPDLFQRRVVAFRRVRVTVQ